MKVISYGGGVQSTAMIVLAVQGEIDATCAVWANVGDDSEHPATIAYIREVMVPWCGAAGFPMHEIRQPYFDNGDERTLYRQLLSYNGCQSCGVTADDECSPRCTSTRNTGGDLPIPVYLEPSGAPVARSCTKHWKVLPIERWLADNGATPDSPATVHIGISVDEIHRANTRQTQPLQRRTYPLLDLGLTRDGCSALIAAAGLPIPPKSACWFCPYHRPQQWAERLRDDPELFAKGVALEDHLNVNRRNRGRPPVYLTKTRRPLSSMNSAPPDLFSTIGDDGCDEGACWT